MYGAIYNVHAINDVKGIAPDGWRVPTDTDFGTLRTFLGGELIAGGKLKEIGTTYWTSPNTGATNEYEFNARGSGWRNLLGGPSMVFEKIKDNGYFWTSTNFDSGGFPYAYYYVIFNYALEFVRAFDQLVVGMPIRCMRDV